MVWQWVIRSVLHRHVQDKLYGAVSEEVQRRMAAGAKESDEAEADPAPGPTRYAAGIVFRSSAEQGGLDDLLDGAITIQGQGVQVREGLLAGRRVALVHGGTAAQSADAARWLIASRRPSVLVAAGFALALRDDLPRFALLGADRLRDSAGATCRLANPQVPIGEESSAPLRVGTLLSLPRPAKSIEEKRSLAGHDLLAADTTSWAIAEVAARHAMPFYVVRIVRELLADAPRLPQTAQDPRASIARRAGATLASLIDQPSSIKGMLQDKEHDLRASDTLARYLHDWVAQLPLDETPDTDERPDTDEPGDANKPGDARD
jgi:nucleoside phosphorylase